jgi:hypothetical protein
MDRSDRQPPDDDTNREAGPAIREDVHWNQPLRMRPTPHNMGHFTLMLAAGEDQNLAAWEKLPTLEGANRFEGVRPRAAVLAEADGKDPPPLLVSQDYGRGRVMAFAGDSTWRWCMHGFASAHKRFWRQIVLWLARKDQLSEGNVWVRLDNTRFFPGDRVEFTCGAQSPQNEPLSNAEYEVKIVKPDGKKLPVVTVRKEDHAAGSFRETLLPGDYAIEVTASRGGAPLGTAPRARFVVSQQDLELDDPSADLDSMKGVAKSSGGEVIEPERLPHWLADLMNNTAYLDVKQETKQSLWDQWPFFVSVVLLLTVEWYLRKRWGLV